MNVEFTSLANHHPQAAIVSITARSFSEQLRLLHLRKEQVMGKRILTLGPGSDFALEKGCADAGAEAVMTLGYFDGNRLGGAHDFGELRGYSNVFPVSALFEDIGSDKVFIPENTFDCVISVWGFPHYSPLKGPNEKGSERHLSAGNTMSALVRSLRSRGFLRFAPVEQEVGRYQRSLIQERFGKRVSVQSRRNNIIDADSVLSISRKD